MQKAVIMEISSLTFIASSSSNENHKRGIPLFPVASFVQLKFLSLRLLRLSCLRHLALSLPFFVYIVSKSGCWINDMHHKMQCNKLLDFCS